MGLHLNTHLNPDILFIAILGTYNFGYGNTGCGVFEGGIQDYKDFWLNITCSQTKLLNFENWSSGELSKIGHHSRK